MPANHCTPHTAEAKAKMSAARVGKPAPWKRRETLDVDGVLQYRCGRCEGFFPYESFYKNKRTLLGIKSECKACHSATSIASRDVERARDSNRDYMARARSADPEKFRERERKAAMSRSVNERTAARAAVHAALKAGRLVRPGQCQRCGAECTPHAHHHDYADQLGVEWLCPRCHGKEHRHARPAEATEVSPLSPGEHGRAAP